MPLAVLVLMIIGLRSFRSSSLSELQLPQCIYCGPISRGEQSSRASTKMCGNKSALGWLANKGEWWMPRLEKAMKDAA